MRTLTNVFFRTSFAPILRDLTLSALDVGARGSFDPELLPVAAAVDICGLEPEPAECARLQSNLAKSSLPWRRARVLPFALSGTGGRRTLHVPQSGEGASLLEHDQSVGAAFRHPALFEIKSRHQVDTITLSEAATKVGLASLDYLKLDIEGIELEVMKSGPDIVESLLALKTEVSFIRMRRHQPIAAEIDTYLQEKGFCLMNFSGEMRWRRFGWAGHPQVRFESVPYSRGQIAHGDYLYFRNMDTLDDSSEAGLERGMKAALLAMNWGYFDHALLLLRRPAMSKHVRTVYGLDPTEAVRAASLRYGRRVWARAFLELGRRGLTLARSAPAATLAGLGLQRFPRLRRER
ncbi:MAG: FkbM family methyltransferase [Myxococcaceae bacterium]